MLIIIIQMEILLIIQANMRTFSCICGIISLFRFEIEKEAHKCLLISMRIVVVVVFFFEKYGCSFCCVHPLL